MRGFLAYAFDALMTFSPPIPSTRDVSGSEARDSQTLYETLNIMILDRTLRASRYFNAMAKKVICFTRLSVTVTYML